MSASPSEERMDANLEHEIDEALERMLTAATDTEKRAWFAMMVVRIRRRSPAQVMKMEMQRRLLRQTAKS